MDFEGDAAVGPLVVLDTFSRKKMYGIVWKLGNLTAHVFLAVKPWDTAITQAFWRVGYQHILDNYCN